MAEDGLTHPGDLSGVNISVTSERGSNTFNNNNPTIEVVVKNKDSEVQGNEKPTKQKLNPQVQALLVELSKLAEKSLVVT